MHGLRVSTPEQTFLDLAAVLPLVDLVVLGDSLVRRGCVTPSGLVASAASHRGPGCRAARRAAALVRAGVDSAMETRLRLLMVFAGLPEPVVNHVVRREDGRVRYRFDLSFPAARLVIEYDGRQHAESERQWGHDIGRREWLDTHGYRLVVVRSTDVYRTPARTLARIITVMRGQDMAVPRLLEGWRRHFPSGPDDVRDPASAC